MVRKGQLNDAVIRHEVQSVQFGFYTDEQVRERSVVEVTSPVAFDPNHTPLPNGLYDPRMGPFSKRGDQPVCATCALTYHDCPGHFGHVELAVPVHHPLLLDDLLTILRCSCLACHALRPPKRPLLILQAKLHLLFTNQIKELETLDDTLAATMQQARQDGNTDKLTAQRAAAQAMDQLLKDILLSNPPQTTTSTKKPAWKLSSYHKRIYHALKKECIQLCKSTARCAHCGAYSPKLRHDSSNKIFQVELSQKMKRLNASEGIELHAALSKQNANPSTNYDSDDSRPNHNNSNNNSDDSDDDSDDPMEVDDDDDDDDESGKKKPPRDKYMHTKEVQAQLKLLWQKEPWLCHALFGGGGGGGTSDTTDDKTSYQTYFMQAIPVPASRFRPPMSLNGQEVEHVQTGFLSQIVTYNAAVRDRFALNQEASAYTAWIDLQTAVNVMMDSSKDPKAGNVELSTGIRQILERKQGLFRQHMMGKRVDYSCRSVISPDPYVGTNEIGLPRYFAHILTYPTPVTDWNIREMRELVERGPHHYPGARWVEVPGQRRMDLSKMNDHKRQAVAAQLLASSQKKGRPMMVGRQLRDGDYVLMNRQPTLHKPGIMAHRVRVLHDPNQKTIRMHYANCNTYNADYDGDEMNCHFPQSDLARAEAQFIAQTDLQYIVPTDGSPLRGLIQDHVVGGVKLTKKDTFLEKWEYQQLLFAALSSLSGLEILRSSDNIEMLPPALVKPRPLWTGKQVISTLLLHLSKGSDRDNEKLSNFPGLSAERKSKTPNTAFGAEQQEHLVLIRDGELLRGVLDKAAFGSTDFSLVHAVYEAYGPEKAGLLLNSLGRLFTAYIQYYAGHSCRMEDLILTKEADEKRKKLVQRAYNVGTRAAKAWADSEGGKMTIPPVWEEDGADQPLKPVETASTAAKIGVLLSGNEGKENFAALDGFMQGRLNPLASDMVKKALPSGLAVQFPYNSFGIMTTTGAKGSIVNQSQVTCALGQQALEGRRVPRMSSGRTLPSFAPYDPNPRADGFVMDRFLTGIRPQEYYFHCMAGREGLVDTAVKTSRSGYLQRCLMKHLEDLKICYDFTVRNSGGEVVQFLYGEDGLDPTKASYLDCSEASFEYFARNYDSVKRHNRALPSSSIDIANHDAIKHENLESGTDIDLQKGETVLARRLRSGDKWVRGAICQGWNLATITKIHKDGTVDLIYKNDRQQARRVPIETDLGGTRGHENISITHHATLVKSYADEPIISSASRGHLLGSSGACVSERVASAASKSMADMKKLGKVMKEVGLSEKQFSALIGSKYSSSVCSPGEAVGSIAAQSVGEPSTQMTLNTFHLAGSGANVTLGIPRLREIIMTASRELKTPTMSVPLLDSVSDGRARRLAREFKKLSVMDLISGNCGVSVTERLEKGDSGEWLRAYYVTLKFYPAERIKEAFGLSLHDIAKVVAKNLVPLLSQHMKREIRRSAVDGDSDVGEIRGGVASEYLEEIAEEKTSTRPPQSESDELNEADDDDDMDDVPGEEDGVEFGNRASENESDEEAQGELSSDDEEGASPDAAPNTPHESQSPESAETILNDKAAPAVLKRSNSIALQALKVEPNVRPLLMVGLVEKAAASTLVRSRKGLSEAFINDEVGRGRCLQTAGVNFQEMWKLDMVKHQELLSNDIWAVRCAYGVEAARGSIVNQIRGVFGVYGIEVDPRHLSLIADYMTFDGGFKPMSRLGMEDCNSSLLQMSFETTANFLKKAALTNAYDTLDSPSANIVLGRPVHHGTGSFALLTTA